MMEKTVAFLTVVLLGLSMRFGTDWHPLADAALVLVAAFAAVSLADRGGK